MVQAQTEFPRPAHASHVGRNVVLKLLVEGLEFVNQKTDSDDEHRPQPTAPCGMESCPAGWSDDCGIR